MPQIVELFHKSIWYKNHLPETNMILQNHKIMIKKNLQTLGLKVLHSMQIKYFIPILILHLSFSLSGQTPEYVSPVKIPVFLSGNFAELRSNHFHSGIDIKTQGITG